MPSRHLQLRIASIVLCLCCLQVAFVNACLPRSSHRRYDGSQIIPTLDGLSTNTAKVIQCLRAATAQALRAQPRRTQPADQARLLRNDMPLVRRVTMPAAFERP